MAFSPITDPEIAKAVAEAWVNGASSKEIAEQFDVTHRTVQTWVKDPRVAAHARAIAIERMLRITRRVDSQIEARLAGAADMDTDLLLKIRKEYLERGVKVIQGEDKDAGDATIELAEALDNDPDFDQKLRKLMESSTEGK